MKSARIVSVLIAVLLVTAFLASPAAAARDPFRGIWISTDIDGSSQRLMIGGGPGGNYRVFLFDDAATVCGLDPDTGSILYAATARGLLSRTGDTLNGDLPVRCLSRPPSTIGPFPVTYTYDAFSDTLTDTVGVVWSRR